MNSVPFAVSRMRKEKRIFNPFLRSPGPQFFFKKLLTNKESFVIIKLPNEREVKKMKKYLVTVCIEYEVVAETDYEAKLEAESMFRASSHNTIDYFITEERKDS